MSIFPTFQKRNLLDPRFWGELAAPSKSGIPVSEKNALKYLTVFSCVSLIAGDVARLPLILYRRFPDGSKERMVNHPKYDIFHTNWGPELTSFSGREAAQGHLLLWGNHYAVKQFSRFTKELSGLVPIENPGAVVVKKSGGRLVYEWTEENKKVTATRDQIFHVPGFGFDGLIGQSMIGLAREAIGLGLAGEEFSARFYGQGTHLAGVLEMDEWIGPEKAKDVKEMIKKGFSGLGKSHSVFVAEGGMKYKPMTMPLKDAQHIESRDYQKLEICGMYHVPPHKVAKHGSNSNYNNLEQENAGYLDSCLMHWIVRWEQAISQQLLTEKERRAGLFVEFLVDGLLRPDSQARAEYYTKLFQLGGMSPNDILAKENMNPVEGGDQRFVPLNMIPLNMAADIVKQQKEPQPEPQQPPDEQKSIDRYEHRSVVARDRIAAQYQPLIKRSAQKIVNLEGLAVKRQLEKHRKLRADGSMVEWLEEFYRSLDGKIRDELGPVFRALSQAIMNEATDELGVDFSQDQFDEFVRGYLDAYAARHIKSSLGQLRSLAEEDPEKIEIRVDEWEETRPDKIAGNETVRIASGMFQTVAFSAGLATVWKIRGIDTCPYCKALAGKKVRTGQSYFQGGEEYHPDGADSGPMKIRGIVRHPPLHRGCDCYLGVA